jgi:hypothetical protein
MARITYGGLITDMSGSVGGSTLQRSQYGPIIRTKPRPIRPNSQNQLNVRAIMARIQYAWRNLSDTDRSLWNTFNSYSLQTIRRSNTVSLTGYALFVKYNFLRILNGGSLMTTFVYVPMPAQNIDWIFFSDEYNPVGFTDNGGNPWDDLFTSIRITPARQPHLSWSPRGLRWIPAESALSFGFDCTTWAPENFGRQFVVGEVSHFEITVCSRLAPIIMKPVRQKFTLVAL